MRIVARRTKFALTAIATLVSGACSDTARLTEPGAEGQSAAIPGTLAPGASRADGPSLSTASTTGGLHAIYSAVGKVVLSIDGIGTTNSAGTVQVEKPAGATVRKAFLLSVTAPYGQPISNGAISIDGTAAPAWLESVATRGWYTHYTDVTSLVQAKIDAAPAGRVDLTIGKSPSIVDGSVLAVVFDDPSQAQDNTVALMFGGQLPTGDTFTASLASPLDKADPDLALRMSLGIGFGYQASGWNTGQRSLIDVNGGRLTSCAGGQDDGTNGGLITVGGLDDDPANPPSATDCPYGPRYDDELYDLRPFTSQGDTQISVTTLNPSNDDMIFFAGFFMTVKGSITAPNDEDTSAPVIVPTVTGTLSTTGWYTSTANVSWTVTDGESAISSSTGCDASTVTSDTDGLTLTCTATSAGGTASESVTVKVDGTAPSIASSLTGTLGTNGWYRSDVAITWSVTDATSGVATSCAAASLTTDGTQAFTCTATDLAGNSASSGVTVKRDATVPAISFSGNAGTYTVDQTVTITCAADDATSGLASDTCADLSAPAYAFDLGSNSISASAVDKAGNTGTASTSFTVTVTEASLCTLATRWAPAMSVSLCKKLQNAAAAGARGNTGARTNMIGAFTNEVRAQAGKRIGAADAATLVRLAQAL